MKRIVALFVCLFLMGGMLSSFSVAAASPIRVLAIGHSYSNNATEFIDDITESMGLAGRLEVYSLYYNGCSLSQHVSFYNNNEAVYELWKGGKKVKAAITMQQAFDLYRYDYVTLQQEPGQAARYGSFEGVLGQLAAIVHREESQAKLQIHQTWAFCHDCAGGGHQYVQFAYPSSDAMFADIESSYAKAAKEIGAVGIVPSGEAIQLAKKYGYGDGHNAGATDAVLQCQNKMLYADSIDHLNQRGRYLAACVWIEHFLGKDTRTATYVAPVLQEDDCAKLREIAHETVTGVKGPLPTTVTKAESTTTTNKVTTEQSEGVGTTTVAEEPVDTGADNTMMIMILAVIGVGVLIVGGMVTVIIVLLKKK